MTEHMNILMSLMGKHGLPLIIISLPVDGRGLTWAEKFV